VKNSNRPTWWGKVLCLLWGEKEGDAGHAPCHPGVKKGGPLDYIDSHTSLIEGRKEENKGTITGNVSIKKSCPKGVRPGLVREKKNQHHPNRAPGRRKGVSPCRPLNQKTRRASRQPATSRGGKKKKKLKRQYFGSDKNHRKGRTWGGEPRGGRKTSTGTRRQKAKRTGHRPSGKKKKGKRRPYPNVQRRFKKGSGGGRKAIEAREPEKCLSGQ